MIKSVMFFRNGNAAVFDERGDQPASLQQPWILMYMSYLTNQGVDIHALDITMPDGRRATIEPMPNGTYTWRIL